MRGLRTISVPRLLRVEAGALHGLADALDSHFTLDRVAVVTGTRTSRSLAETLVADLERRGSHVDLHHSAEGKVAASARLLERLDDAPVSLVVAFGGGRPIDVAKLAAARAGVDLVAVPTVLSHDGMCSPVASLEGPTGAGVALEPPCRRAS